MHKVSVFLSAVFGFAFFGAGLLSTPAQSAWAVCFFPAIGFMIAAVAIASN